MPYIAAGANQVFPAGTFPNNASLDDTHNVGGNVTYQIGAAPAVVAHFNVNDPPYVVPVNGLQFTVTNNLAASLLVT